MTDPSNLVKISKLRVRYAETDQMGVVYYGNYFVWMEVGRTDLLYSTGLSYREMEQQGIMTPVIHTEGRYYAPCSYDDLIEIHTELSHLTRVKARFDAKIYRTNPTDNQRILAFEGYTEHAFIDTSHKKVTHIPKEWIEMLKKKKFKKDNSKENS